jgi:catechol 2,3-dioxygenase-like lactoylglutathione lyase family enzyme
MQSDAHLPIRFLGERVQLAFVVKNMDAAIKYWTETLRVGPFIVIEKSRGDRTVYYRGAETPVDFSIAFAYMGDVQIEFIQPTDDEPSIYKEFLDSGREGFHHVAYWPKDFEAACAHLEASGFSEISSVRTRDGKRNVAYYETPQHIGSIVEIVPLTADRAAYFSRIQRLSQTWDGVTRPVRRFVDRAAFLASGEGTA